MSPCVPIAECALVGAPDLAARARLLCFKEDINNFGFAPVFFLFPVLLLYPPPPPPLPPPPPNELVVPMSKRKYIQCIKKYTKSIPNDNDRNVIAAICVKYDKLETCGSYKISLFYDKWQNGMII